MFNLLSHSPDTIGLSQALTADITVNPRLLDIIANS